MRVIGVGQRDRGDDAVGLDIVQRLRSHAGAMFEVASGAADAAALLAQFEGVDAVVAVDCARGGGPPGTILSLGPKVTTWSQQRATSSHGNALADALALGAALGCLPRHVSVLVVVGASFALGAPMSAAVQAAVPEAAAQVLREATRLARRISPPARR